MVPALRPIGTERSVAHAKRALGEAEGSSASGGRRFDGECAARSLRRRILSLVTAPSPASARPGPDPDGGTGGVHELLVAAVEEAARLLDADGAMVYLIDPATGHLRFAHDAGIRDGPSRDRVRSIDLPVGVGMFGRAVAERSVVLTPDYLADASFPHAPDTDRVVRDIGIRSMVVAPLVADDTVFGAIGTYAPRPDTFSASDVALVRALADHAAAAMANARLIDDLDASRRELAERADIERTVREIAARISAAADLPAVLQLSVDEAARLLHAEGARIDLIEPRTGFLRLAYASGDSQPDDAVTPDDPGETMDQGVSGRAVVSGHPYWTGDYAADTRFPHGRGSDEYVALAGVHSVMAAPLTTETGPIGTLSVLTIRRDAWSEPDSHVLAAIADQAAITIRTTRLIEETDRAREAQVRRAEVEQALREVAARITAMREPDEILRDVVRLASQLFRADGVILDLLDPSTGNLHWAMDDGLSDTFDSEARAKLWISVGVGATGIALAEDRVIIGDDDLASLFPPSVESAAFYERTRFRSMIAAPITGDGGPLGVLEVYSRRPAAFGSTDAGFVGALASQAAIAITNARLIDELARSRGELARTADSERTLREIAARVSAILEPDEVLQRIVDEAIRLLASDGARIDLFDAGSGVLRWSFAAGPAMEHLPDWAADGGLLPGQAVAGKAFTEQRPVRTDDYLADARFSQDDAAYAFVVDAGIRSVVAVPLAADLASSTDATVPFGTLSVASRQVAAYDDADEETLTALATQAAIAIRNARLIEALARSRAVIERRADAEKTLREIATRITAIRRPEDLLQRIVDEAQRLLRADGAVIDAYDPEAEVLVAMYDAGLTDDQRTSVRSSRLRIGEGLSGRAMAEGRVVAAGEYLGGDFTHIPSTDEMAARTGIGDLIVAPIIGDDGPLGAIEVYRRDVHSFDDIDAAVLGGLADQAAIAITNAHLIEELERSQAALARRADTERALREITAGIAALRDPDVILDRVVSEARRLLATDGAHLTRMSDDRTHLIPVIATDGSDPETRSWLLGMEFPLGGGINGLAADRGEPTWTRDYQADPRVPHDPSDDEVAQRLGLCGMAAAPLRAPGGEVIGTLAISSATPRDFDPEELDLLQGLADQAAIAITNSTLLARSTESEVRFRTLAASSPDMVFETDADGHWTFLSDRTTEVLGWPIDAMIGQHFSGYIAPGWEDLAASRYADLVAEPTEALTVKLDFRAADGRAVPLDINVIGSVHDGRLAAIHGVARDVSERERLEHQLQSSEERYRFLVENSPDVVFSTDVAGHFTFMSEAMERLTGWRPDELLGQHFSVVVNPMSHEEATARWQALASDPDTEQVSRLELTARDGRNVPVEVSALGIVDPDGRFNGIHGSTRDISERDRLERDLRRQAGELAAGEERAHLARELHDSVTQALFSMTLVSRSVELLLERDLDEARARLGTLRDLQREALAEMRALIFELRPGNLEQDGLPRALRTHSAALQGRIGLPVAVESTIDERLPLSIEEALYRIAQEALHNVVKHAGAHQARVELGRVSTGVRLAIIDDGKGFDPDHVAPGHLGIAGMQARAEKMGADLAVKRPRRGGTVVEVTVPVAAIVAAGAAGVAPPARASIRDG
jgi:PAS domain S-box-containing protein